MLKRLFVDNYRCLVNFDFAPQKINLLVGDNGSGKTTVFEVLWLLKRIVCEGALIASTFQTSLLTKWDDRRVHRFELQVEGEGGLYLYKLEIGYEGNPEAQAAIRLEQLDWNGRPLYLFRQNQVHLFRDDHAAGPVFPFQSKISFLPSLQASANARKLSWFMEYLGGLRIHRPIPSHIESLGVESDAFRLDCGNLASIYPRVAKEHPEFLPEFYLSLATVLAGFQVLRVLPRGGSNNELTLSFVGASGSGSKAYELPLAALSDGQRMLVVLYFLVLLVRVAPSGLLCLDEPDNYVSLREIQPWLRVLSDVIAAGPGQVMIISHHPEVIDYLAADTAFLFERPDGGPSRVRPLEVDRASGLKASEWLARGMSDGEA